MGTHEPRLDQRIIPRSLYVGLVMSRPAIVFVAVAVFVGATVIGYVVFGEQTDDEAQTLVPVTQVPIEYEIERDSDVPPLPFDDNPDPAQCGIPVQWGENGQAWLTGFWDGDLIQAEVLVYDSPLRVSVTGRAPHGTEVEIVLYQENPVIDYYFVRIPGDVVQEGWVPEPFLSLEPVA